MSGTRDNFYSLGRLLSKASRLLNMRINEEFSRYEIGSGQLHSLLALYGEEDICQKEICEIYNLDKAAVGRALNKLEKKDFIERKPDQNDKRRKKVYLTEKGKSFKPECLARLKKIEEDLKKVLTPEEIEIFKESVEKICENLVVSLKKQKKFKKKLLQR